MHSPLNVSIPSGFAFGSASAGIRKKGSDLGVIYSQAPAAYAAAYTENKFAAPPILYNKSNVSGVAQLVVANSGVANACTGNVGKKACKQVASCASKVFGVPAKGVVLASTGVIGKELPVRKVTGALGCVSLGGAPSDVAGFASAIQTTDRTMKVASAKAGGATVLGIAKGAGMICPTMATMLCFIVTDADVGADAGTFLANAVGVSFNCITVDGCQSTNDSVILLANGLAGKVKPDEFQEAIDLVCLELAKAIVADGEGAQQVFEVAVTGAVSMQEAKEAGRAILNNPLVQTGFSSFSPNTGRLAAALGSAKAQFDPLKVKIWLGGKLALKGGKLEGICWQSVPKTVSIVVDLGAGDASAKLYGCDLTCQYVQLNNEYLT